MARTESPMPRPTIAIVDAPRSRHGVAMSRAARLGRIVPRIIWVPPSLALPAHLLELPPEIVAIAVPLTVAGGGPGDLFTDAVVASLATIQSRGTSVFVAAGNRR